MKIQVGDKELNVRKWKGKDKKNFINSLQKNDTSEKEIMDTIVYSCIEEDVVLSVDEFRYVLSRIRANSLGEEIDVEFYCNECGNVHNHTFELKDIIRYRYEPLSEIKVKDVHIQLGEIKNREAYIKRVAQDEIYDFLMRIESFNGDSAFTLETLMEKFDDLDLDILEEIMAIYEASRFKVQDENEVVCPHCGHAETFIFDELPGFFPDSWFTD